MTIKQRKPRARWRRGKVHDKAGALFVLTRAGRDIAWVFRRLDKLHWHVSVGAGQWLRGRALTIADAKLAARNALRQAEMQP